MKSLIIAMSLIGAGLVHADESASDHANDVKRSMKKAGHHIEEAVCMEGDVKCAAKKLKHRAKEGADYTKDKAKEIEKKAD